MTEQRISDGTTKTPSSYYKVFEYRKHNLSDLIIENYNLHPRYMFVEAKAVKNLTIRNCIARLKEPQTGGNIPFGVIIRSGEDVTVEGCTFEDFKMVPDGGYGNGDGCCAEREAKNIRWINNIFRNNGDGGLDTKATNDFIQGNLSEGNYRNFRLWGSGQLINNISRNPRSAHLWFNLAGGGEWKVSGQQFFDEGTKPHIQIDSGKAGQVLVVVDPVVNGVKVTDLSQIRIIKNATGKLVDVQLKLTPQVDIILAAPLWDSNNDGRIALSAPNQKKFGAKVLIFVGEVEGGYGYVREK